MSNGGCMAKRPRHAVLDTPCIFQVKSTESDDFGGEYVTWVDDAYDVCERMPLRGNTQVSQMQLQEGLTERVTIRFRHGVDRTQRITFPVDGTTLNIHRSTVGDHDSWYSHVYSSKSATSPNGGVRSLSARWARRAAMRARVTGEESSA